MKLLKRLISVAACAVAVVCSLSGCDFIFKSNGCRHKDGGTVGSDESTHYKICVTCGEKYDVEEHILNFEHNSQKHFMRCVICSYVCDEQAHTFGEWNRGSTVSTRTCTVKECKYKEECRHEHKDYVVGDTEHHLQCGNCKYDFAGSAHIFSKYTDVTETTHSKICECGKLNGDPVPHVLEYEKIDDEHWQVCACGYETAKEGCTYGNYVCSDDTHYRICSVCNKKSDSEAHDFNLTLGRERKCGACGYVQSPDSLMVGTWECMVDRKTYQLILSSDWSYKEIKKSTGEIIAQGDYHVYRTTNLDGTVTGSISLSASMSIEFKFKKGETAKFWDGYKYYFKA